MLFYSHAFINYTKVKEGIKMKSFFTKVVGITKPNEDGTDRQEILDRWRRLRLVRDPANLYDKNAIRICLSTGEQIGFLSADVASELAKKIDKGKVIDAVIHEITGGEEGKESLGCNIKIMQ
jgi:hypothetical protein